MTRPLPPEQLQAINEVLEAGNRAIAEIMASPTPTLDDHFVKAFTVAGIVSETADAVASSARGAYA